MICGLGLMAFAEFAKVRSGGPAIAIGLGVALVASLTLAPALLRIMGTAVFWPVGRPRLTIGAPHETVWGWLSKQVTARPVTIWVTSVAILLPLAVLGFQVRAAYRATGELSANCQSVTGLSVVERHFNAGEVGPVTVLLESATDWAGPQGQAVLRHLSQGILHLDNIAEVRSFTQPLGQPIDDTPAPPIASNQSGGMFGSFIKNVRSIIGDQVKNGGRDVYLAAAGGRPRGSPALCDAALM